VRQLAAVRQNPELGRVDAERLGIFGGDEAALVQSEGNVETVS
jgi:hypothetical protein